MTKLDRLKEVKEEAKKLIEAIEAVEAKHKKDSYVLKTKSNENSIVKARLTLVTQSIYAYKKTNSWEE